VIGERQSLTPAQAAAIKDGVRAFMRVVAHDVRVELEIRKSKSELKAALFLISDF